MYVTEGIFQGWNIFFIRLGLAPEKHAQGGGSSNEKKLSIEGREYVLIGRVRILANAAKTMEALTLKLY